MKKKRVREVEVSTQVTTRVKNVDQQTRDRRKRVQVFPKSLNQESYLLKLCDPSKVVVFGVGPAGGGKSYLAVQIGIKLFQEGMIDKIVITRPVIPADEDLGFLPGTLTEKMSPWVRPMLDIFEEHYTPKEVEKLIEDGDVEIAPLAYMRGRTFRNSYIILDEGQNTSISQIKMITTRIGEGSKLVITGDLEQSDRIKENGLFDFINRLKNYKGSFIDIVHFTNSDIQRHPVIEEILNLYNS